VTRLGWLAAYLLLTSCQPAPSTVDAAEYNSFWLWAGVKPQRALDKARTIYILEGEVRGSGQPQLISLRPATPQIRHAELWIVYRVETIDWNEPIYEQVVSDLARWRGAGNRVIGVQIDFDAATKGLGGYADFLRKLRERLPRDSALSVTGLLDWSSQGDSADLNQLASVVDELVLQTYQARATIPGYESYMAGLERLDMPFKIGLVQNGEWKAPAALAKDPDFRGYVVFLVNPRT
jgi:Protein of unknown function (DUF3142)